MKQVLWIISLVCLCMQGTGKPQDQPVYPLTGHPRLFFLSSDETVLKEKLNTTPDLNKVHNLIITECSKIISLPVQQRILTGRRLLSVSREAIRRISFLSYAYRMTGEVSYANRAETEMLAMAAFSDWNPSHFLDVAEMTMAMSIGYDWLYHYLSQASRSTVSSAIKNKGIEETTGSKANQSWLKSDNNWNQVCNAGISAGVAAIFDENPGYYQPLIDRAVNSVKIPMEVYKYNGAYPEGMGYWDYGTTFNIMLIDMLQRMWGTDRELLSTEGFLKTVDFVTHMQGNATKQLSGGSLKSMIPLPFNFADCGTGIGILPAMFWLAARSSDQSVLYGELQKLAFILSGTGSGLTNDRFLPFLLIWSINLNVTDLPSPKAITYLAQGKSAVAAMRTGWGANDIYLAVKGGTPSSNHAHMDIGSFVMEAMDVRWAMDFGSSDYNTLETNGVDLWNMSQTSERWDVFRYNNMAHNTLTLNGKKQLVSGNSGVENLINTDTLKSASLNLTSLYKEEVTSCQRTVAIVSGRYAEIRDAIEAGTKDLTVRWNLLTQAIPNKVSDHIIRLTQSSKTLYLIFESAGAVTAKAWPTRPSTSYEEKNSDTYFAGFEFQVPHGSPVSVKVRMIPDGDSLLKNYDLKAAGVPLDENFENFGYGAMSSGFVTWKTNPASDGNYKAILGEVTENPWKSGINLSNKVLRIRRQEDILAITTSNAGSVTYRGIQAYGYDLNVNTNSIVEFKYFKDAPGKIGIRLYDGNGNMVLSDYSDPYENTMGYSTAQWRTAQFEVGKLDLSKFRYTPSGYLLISPERNGTENYQEKELTLYVDDVKMLPLSTRVSEIAGVTGSLSAFYEQATGTITVVHLPQNTRLVRLYDTTGRLLQETSVMGTKAIFNLKGSSSNFYIVKTYSSDRNSRSVKVVKHL